MSIASSNSRYEDAVVDCIARPTPMFVIAFGAGLSVRGKRLEECREQGSVQRLSHVRTRLVHSKAHMERIAHHREGLSDSSPAERYVCQLVE